MAVSWIVYVLVSFNVLWRVIQVCITNPCQNGATCADIDAEQYTCSCSVGRDCNAQPSENKLAVYIAVPVSIVVIIVFVVTITVFLLRKRLNQKKDSQKTVHQNTANTGHSSLALANNAYNDHEISVNVNATEDKDADATKIPVNVR